LRLAFGDHDAECSNVPWKEWRPWIAGHCQWL
jgi:hypothetical protein